MNMRRKRPDPRRIAELERELGLEPTVDPSVLLAHSDRPTPAARLGAVGLLSFGVGVVGSIVVTSVGDANGAPDAVWDHGLLGWVFGTLMVAPLVAVIAYVVGVVMWALIGTALGRSL